MGDATPQDPLNFARDIILDRLTRRIPDERERWLAAVAIVNHLDMCGLIVGGVGDRREVSDAG